MSTVTDTRAHVLREVSLTICGRREGKTAACTSCLRKTDAVVHTIRGFELNTALLPRLADIICGAQGQPRASCWEKATTLLLELRP
ncbi:hypothetical protein ACFQZ0_00320 [Streptomyces erythrogriseus]|uniref:Uncharacterized protein n=1 Tax=Streptomyces erythrogriseus TaxID=284027 RepID=A0ABN3WL31_9ACTN